MFFKKGRLPTVYQIIVHKIFHGRFAFPHVEPGKNVFSKVFEPNLDEIHYDQNNDQDEM